MILFFLSKKTSRQIKGKSVTPQGGVVWWVERACGSVGGLRLFIAYAECNNKKIDLNILKNVLIYEKYE
jgi:hypothetical protein